MEYALKQKGFLINGMAGANAQASWHEFAKSPGGEFFRDTQKDSDVAAFCAKPPKKQVVDENGSPCWKDVAPVSDNASLFTALRRLRNNLFHGGKSDNPGDERNIFLFRAGIEIIRASLDCSPDLKQVFEDGYCRKFRMPSKSSRSIASVLVSTGMRLNPKLS